MATVHRCSYMVIGIETIGNEAIATNLTFAQAHSFLSMPHLVLGEKETNSFHIKRSLEVLNNQADASSPLDWGVLGKSMELSPNYNPVLNSFTVVEGALSSLFYLKRTPQSPICF